jgi:hypothetical protein
MKKLFLYFISVLFFLGGILFFCYQESWIIINIPQNTGFIKLQKPTVKKSCVPLWAFKQNKWITETTEIIKNDAIVETLQNLLNSWFLFLEEEQILGQAITVTSVVMSPTNTLAFISLSQNPLNPQASTYESMMLMESMLKTIRENKIPIQSIQLLVKHQPLIDQRLNLSIPWQISGYINS